MVWVCYLRNGIVYVPTEARVETGGYQDIDPVFVIPIHDADGIRSALKELIAQGNPTITSEMVRNDYPGCSLLKLAGVKSWGTFMKGAFSWTINDLSNPWKVVGKRKGLPRGWFDDPEQTAILQPGATIDDVCDKLIAMVQAKAAEQ